MLKQASSPRSFFSAVLLLAAALFFASPGEVAQAQSSSKPAYFQQYSEAMQMAKQGNALQQQDDVEGAIEKYEASYRQLAQAAEGAREAGNVENTNMIELRAAQIANRAGTLLYKNDRIEESFAHYEFGQQVAPPDYTKNATDLQKARAKLQSVPVAEASQMVSEQNYRGAVERLSAIEEQTSTTYFYQALAYQGMGDSESAIAFAGRSLEAGGLSNSRQAQMHLIIGEERVKMGENEAARQPLERAIALGGSAIRDAAQYVLDQI